MWDRGAELSQLVEPWTVGLAGFEPATRGLKAPCSDRAELQAPTRRILRTCPTQVGRRVAERNPMLETQNGAT